MKYSFFVQASASIPMALLVGAIAASGVHAQDTDSTDRGFSLFAPSVPPQNPITEEKRVLGKILFWDEQLSSDNTMSCGTCHIPTAGGGDPRPGPHPGFDQVFNTPDDVSGSPGMISMDSNEEYLESVLFELLPQSGNRVSPSFLMAAYAFNLFWDGRAEGQFHDPLTGEIAIPAGGMLEEQALGPILNPIELAHEGRSWDDVVTKLDGARPMALATNIPPDMTAVISNEETYGDLFAAAFGDPKITPVRIAMAIATYERTTLPNQTPWDLFIAGDNTAMTPQQIQGFNAYSNSRCFFCHGSPIFSNNAFHADGVRAPFEDMGRSVISGINSDRGKFRSPSLRNVGLRNRLMHTGTLTSLDDVFDFYGHRNGLQPHPDNRDFRLNTPILFSQSTETAIKDFLANGLTDPRSATGTFPFDRPLLYSESTAPNPFVIKGTGQTGTNTLMPEPIAVTPPMIGSAEFKVGVKNGLGGATAWVKVAGNPATTNGELINGELFGPFMLLGNGAGNGYATFKFPIDNNPRFDGTHKYFQWRIDDPNALNGVALSPVVGVEMFCTMTGACPAYCVADYTNNEVLDIFDILAFLDLFNAGDELADLTQDGLLNIFDILDFLDAFALGCE